VNTPPLSGHAQGSLARQFTWAAATLAGIAVLLIATGSLLWIEHLQRNAGLALLQKDTELRAAQVATTLRSLDERLAGLAASPLLTTALTDSLGREGYLQPYLGSVQVINAIPVELLLVDFAGNEIARNGDSSLGAEERAWIGQQLKKGRPAASIHGRADAPSLLAASMVVYPRTGTVEGALVVKLALRNVLADPAFSLVAGPASAGADEVVAAVAVPPSFGALQFSVRGPATGLPGAEHLTLAAVALAATLALFASVLLVGRRLAQRLTADLRALDSFAREVAEQAFGDARAPLAGAAEVAGLAQSLNRMLDRLNQQHARLQGAAEAQLRLLATCIEKLNDTVMITEAGGGSTREHRIVFVNDAFERLTGYTREEVLGRTPHFLQGPGTDRAALDQIKRSLARWEPARAELLNYTKDGREIWIELAIMPVSNAQGEVTHWVSVERDTTARREAEATRRNLEAQVREAQKMEAVGTLAGGIAHDFNNILGAILGNVALARREMEADDPAQPRLEQISRSAARARSLVEQILTYSRRQTQQLLPQPLRPLIEETVELLRATVPARVRLDTRFETQPAAAPLHVLGDATALSQVLMNLGTNAWHALRGSTGCIEFGLDLVDWPAQAPPHAAPLPAGPYAHFWVADTGCGMDAATQARIFEPFFTTKPVGSGTGLGLSVVLGIVQSHRGTITIDSTPGVGTRFHVYLPVVAATAALPAPPPVADAAPRGNGQHVLYIDDDEVMVTLADALLCGWGYRVTGLRRAGDALAALRADPRKFDLVVTDFNMPEMSGLELLRELRAVNPGLPVILSSGYLADELRDEATRAGVSALLRKENIQDELAMLVAKALADRAPPASIDRTPADEASLTPH
jgi:PAS domain S-box-containing protein